MSKLTPRLDRLEARRLTSDQRDTRMREDADQVAAALTALSSRLDPAAHEMDAAAWSRLSPAQQVGWAMRFGDWPMDFAIRKLFLEEHHGQHA